MSTSLYDAIDREDIPETKVSTFRQPSNFVSPNQHGDDFVRVERRVARASLGVALGTPDDGWKKGDCCGGTRASATVPEGDDHRLRRSEHVSEVGVSVPYGRPVSSLTPTPSVAGAARVATTVGFADLSSVRAMRRDDFSVVVGFDTEYQERAGSRSMASYQVSWLSNDGSDVHHLAWLPVSGVVGRDRLRLTELLRDVITTGELWSSPLAPESFPREGVPRSAMRVWLAHREDGSVRRCRTLAGAIEASGFEAEREALRASVRSVGGRTVYDESPWSDMPSAWWRLRKGEGVGWVLDESQLGSHALPITLVAHFAKADVGTFRGDDVDLLRHLMEAGGGLMTARSLLVPVRVPGREHPSYWPVRLQVRDSRAHAPAEAGSVHALGGVLGLPKHELPAGVIERMVEYREEDPRTFLEYAWRDCDVAREYVSRVYGENRGIPLTLSSASASAARESLKTYFETPEEADFRRVFTGMERIEKGLTMIEKDNAGPSFAVASNWVPASRAVDTLTRDYQNSYKGGLNACYEVGVIEGPTYDFDLCSAYPTAMAVVQDIDWEHPSGPTIVEWRNEELTPDMVPTPTTPFAGQVSFEFDESVRFPCIPVTVEGSLVFPRSSYDADGEAHPVYASGPEVWLALQLGARVFVHGGAVARLRYTNEGEAGRREKSFALRAAVRQMVVDRATAKETFGKKSVEELTLKTGVNSLYGKTAQDLIEQHSWDAFSQRSVEIGGSAITSAYHACMTTGLVRATLSAALNQLDQLGYRSYSVTTDGFITNAPEDVVTGLDLFGLLPVLREGRQALVGEDDVWEIKHAQEWLLNINTRANVGRQSPTLGFPPVCAHGGYRSQRGHAKNSPEDREELVEVVATRTGKPVVENKEPTPWRNMSTGDPADRRDFTMVERTTKLGTIDYDLKCRPVESSFRADVIEVGGEPFEVCHFETEPWATLDEYRRAREVRSSAKCLRTVNEWRTFWLRYRNSKKGERNIADAGRAVVMAILVGHRLGAWHIPFLASSATVAAKIAWLNAWHITDREHFLKPGDWKNARRPERQTQILPREELEPWLSAMESFEGDGLPSWSLALKLNGGAHTERTSGMGGARR